MFFKRFFLLCIILFSSVSCSNHKNNRRVGDELVNRIEDFRVANDSLPYSLYEVVDTIIYNTLFCYEKVDSLNYIIWYGTTLGEGVYYYSDTKQWEKKLRTIK